MNVHDCFKLHLAGSSRIVNAYLEDLSDSDLLVRAVPGINHIAWQIGHCLSAEHGLMEALKPGAMPKLPEDFDNRHSKAASRLDSPSAFYNKATYVELIESQRAATLKVLDATTAEAFDGPAIAPWNSFLPTVGAMFRCVGEHWLMHAGQWAVTRRKMGRPPLF